MNLLQEIQKDALDTEVKVTTLLRKAKVLATKLDLGDALVWINNELNGYLGLETKDLPDYRKISGRPKWFNPYRGWLPLLFESSKTEKNFSKAPIGQAIGSIENDLAKGSTMEFIFPYPAEIKKDISKSLPIPTDSGIFYTTSQAFGILEAVRNLILNWVLELEKAGISGEGLVFSSKEKIDAEPVTNQFFIQNVGVLGAVTGKAKVSTKQKVEINLNWEKVQEFVQQAKGALSNLPAEVQKEAKPLLDQVEKELKSGKPKSSKIKTALNSLKTICEGAAGNLTAQGIIKMISGFFNP